MSTKTMTAMIFAVLLGTTASALAQGWQGSNGYYGNSYGYSMDRHNPTDTNGF